MAALLCLNIYRAATQSITIDEAFTYEQFASQPLAGLASPFDANNHVLNSVLGRLSVSAFGLSEFSLRLPSLLGGAVYLFAAYRLSFLLFGGKLWSLLMTALLSLDPFLLDHLSVARGYGIGIGFLTLGMYTSIRRLMRGRNGSLYGAALCFGLSVAANLTYVVPVVAFTLALAVVAARSGLDFQQFWSELLVPMVLLPFVLWVIPLSRAKPEAFYFGGKLLSDSLGSLADFSFAYGVMHLSWPLLRYCCELFRSGFQPFSVLVTGMSAACVFWYGGRLYLRRITRWHESEQNLVVFALTVCLVAAFIAGAHILAGVPYPYSRAALYWIPLTFIAASCFLYVFRRSRIVRISATVLPVLCMLCFALQLNVSYYAEWRFDAGTKRIVAVIRAARPATEPLVIRASWPLEPSLNFYRLLYGLKWQPVDRSGPDKPGDIVVLMAEDRAWISKLGLRVMYTDPVSGAVVAAPTKR